MRRSTSLVLAYPGQNRLTTSLLIYEACPYAGVIRFRFNGFTEKFSVSQALATPQVEWQYREQRD
jgi:hypothetical protein